MGNLNLSLIGFFSGERTCPGPDARPRPVRSPPAAGSRRCGKRSGTRDDAGCADTPGVLAPPSRAGAGSQAIGHHRPGRSCINNLNDDGLCHCWTPNLPRENPGFNASRLRNRNCLDKRVWRARSFYRCNCDCPKLQPVTFTECKCRV